MRLLHLGIAAAIGFLLAAPGGASPETWHEPGTPVGGTVYALERGADGTLYAGTLVGVFVSGDGITWRQAGRLPGATDDAGIDAISTGSGATAYAASGGMLFKSRDAGRTWKRTDPGFGSSVVSVWASLAGASDVVYAGTWNDRVYRSADGGATWERTGYGLAEGSTPVTLVAAPDASTVYVGTENRSRDGLEEDSGGVYRSDDAGASWTPLSIGLPLEASIVSLALDPHDRGTIYAGTAGHGIFKSTDGGIRWRAARAGLRSSEGYPRINDLVVDGADPAIVYAATSRGSAMSLDGGTSWRIPDRGDLHVTTLVAVRGADPALVAGTIGRGIVRSVDRAETWRPANDGFTALAAMSIVAEPRAASSVWIGTYESGLFNTLDGGRTWSHVAAIGVRTVRAVAVAPGPRRVVYVGTDDAGVMKSGDDGRSWVRVGREMPNGSVDALVTNPRRPAVVYAAAWGRVYKTIDAGASWRRVSNERVDASVLAVDPQRPETIYAGHYGVAVSSDGGRTWRSLKAGLPRDVEVRALAVAAPTGDAFAAVNAEGESVAAGVFRLARGGRSWARVGVGLPRRADGTLAQFRALATNPRTGSVAVATDLGLFELVRPRGRTRWKLVDAAFAGRTVRRIGFSFDGSRTYAATAGRFLVSR